MKENNTELLACKKDVLRILKKYGLSTYDAGEVCASAINEYVFGSGLIVKISLMPIVCDEDCDKK